MIGRIEGFRRKISSPGMLWRGRRELGSSTGDEFVGGAAVEDEVVGARSPSSEHPSTNGSRRR